MEPITHYQGSRGRIEISKMDNKYLQNAINKIERMLIQPDGELQATLVALKAEFAKREETRKAEGE